ncbi:C25 family cysteine peptidase [Engelhardtia mirabilis]|uniref:Gingipain domain-containing protein n=1 Tax=Engelhardtia mirabilis TaxID=2528011 RepID=A0A518BE35_9BACT|nr:hypothetical protein Pla133_02950 [Planctomycetes bacterium Pla133]QDU99557.1 hypothetical protein Pla86_02950 [Planctomycetes bacterium Pla86]
MLHLLTAAVALAATTENPKTWIPLAGSGPAGAAPTVEVVDELSGPDRTVVHVRIPGIWAETVAGGDGQAYTRLALPGRASTLELLGAPELPVLRFRLAVPPGAQVQAGDAPGEPVVLVDLDQAGPGGSALPLVYPVHEPAWDGDPDAGTPAGVPPAFHFNPTIYFGSQVFPASLVDAQIPVEPLIGGVEAALVELRPLSLDPHGGDLLVRADFQATFEHPAPVPSVLVPVTPGTAQFVEELALNYTKIEHHYYPAIPPSLGNPDRLLIVAPKAQADELLPLIAQRQLCGYDVEFRALSDLPNVSPESIRSAIGAWASTAAPGVSSFALLVGDVQTLPLHPPLSPQGLPSDAGYGTALPGAPGVRVHVGRLSVDDDADLALQIAKIVETERSGSTKNNFKQLGLACHTYHDAHVDYLAWANELAAQIAATGSQVVPQVVGGADPDATAKLLDLVEKGLGYLLYRGQGSSAGWIDWASNGADLTALDLAQLDNDLAPIHWALAPSTADISSDSLAEAWMSAAGGAVAVFGAVGATESVLVHEVGHWLGLYPAQPVALAHGKLLTASELSAEQTYQHTSGGPVSERFLLLGDPAMVAPVANTSLEDDVWIDGKLITAENYDSVIVVGAAGGTAHVRIGDPDGNPVDGALVSLVLGHSSIGPDGELLQPPFQRDVYTENGVAVIEIDLGAAELAAALGFEGKGQGSMQILMGDGSVKFIQDSIDVQFGAVVDLGGQVPDVQGVAPQLAVPAGAVVGQPLSLELTSAPPVAFGSLFVAFEHHPLPFAGGTFHAFPVGLTFPFATDAAGHLALSLGPLPTALPPGFKLVLQAVAVDPLGPLGLVLSNGLLATF